MHTTNLRKVGGSVMLAVPPAVLDMLSLHVGSTVGLSVEDGRLVIEPRRPRYTLDDLLAQCDATADRPAEDDTWLSDAPQGAEEI